MQDDAPNWEPGDEDEHDRAHLLQELQSAQAELEQEDEFLRKANQVDCLLISQASELQSEIEDAESELEEHQRLDAVEDNPQWTQARAPPRHRPSAVRHHHHRRPESVVDNFSNSAVDGFGVGSCVGGGGYTSRHRWSSNRRQSAARGSVHRSSYAGSRGESSHRSSIGTSSLRAHRRSMMRQGSDERSDDEERAAHDAELEALQEELNGLEAQGEELQLVLEGLEDQLKQAARACHSVRASGGSASCEANSRRARLMHAQHRMDLLESELEGQRRAAARSAAAFKLEENELREERRQVDEAAAEARAYLREEIADHVAEREVLEAELEGIARGREMLLERFEREEMMLCAETEEEDMLLGEYEIERRNLQNKMEQLLDVNLRGSSAFTFPVDGGSGELGGGAFGPRRSSYLPGLDDDVSPGGTTLERGGEGALAGTGRRCSLFDELVELGSPSGGLAFASPVLSPVSEAKVDGTAGTPNWLASRAPATELRSRAKAVMSCLRLRHDDNAAAVGPSQLPEGVQPPPKAARGPGGADGSAGGGGGFGASIVGAGASGVAGGAIGGEADAALGKIGVTDEDGTESDTDVGEHHHEHHEMLKSLSVIRLPHEHAHDDGENDSEHSGNYIEF